MLQNKYSQIEKVHIQNYPLGIVVANWSKYTRATTMKIRNLKLLLKTEREEEDGKKRKWNLQNISLDKNFNMLMKEEKLTRIQKQINSSWKVYIYLTESKKKNNSICNEYAINR